MRCRLLAAALVLLAAAAVGVAPAAAGGAGVGSARHVTMYDNRYTPTSAVVALGQAVQFRNLGRVGHDAKDGTGLDLFATGLVDAPDTATVGPLPGAGGYAYYCTFHSEMTGRLDVPMVLSDSLTARGERVTVRWATHPSATGRVFDVQRRRPGADRFVDWRRGVHAAATGWSPAVTGRWVLRARVRDSANGAASDWSPVATLRVA